MQELRGRPVALKHPRFVLVRHGTPLLERSAYRRGKSAGYIQLTKLDVDDLSQGV
jgi:hypothetical protein